MKEKEKPENIANEAEKTKSVTVGNTGNKKAIHALVIAGVVEGHYASNDQAKTTKYEQCIPQLVAVEESEEIGGLLVLLNTVGGDVEAGLAIAELISGMTKPTVSLVIGGGHSIGVPLAVSAKKSFIVPSATMTLHPVRTNGLVIGVRQSFENLKEMQERITRFITEHSHIAPEELERLMNRTDRMTTDIGSVIDGEEAVKLGLIDKVGSLGAALKELRRMMDKGGN